MEKRIEDMESRRDAIDSNLSDPTILTDSARIRELMVERSALSDELSEAYERWEALSLRLEGIVLPG